MQRITKDELTELYVNQGLSLLEIAKRFGYANESCVSYNRDQYGIPARTQGELKIGKHYSPATEWKPGQVATGRPFKKGVGGGGSGWNTGLTKETDGRVMEQSLKVSQSLKGRTYRAKFGFTNEFYDKLYNQDKLSIDSIARLIGCNLSTVWYYLKKYGITRRNVHVAHSMKPSGAERRFMDIVDKHKLPFTYVGDGKFTLDGLCPDFINTNGKKQIIEIFGEYWHNEHDEDIRATRFAKYGFDTVVIWESELNDEQAVLNKIHFSSGVL